MNITDLQIAFKAGENLAMVGGRRVFLITDISGTIMASKIKLKTLDSGKDYYTTKPQDVQLIGKVDPTKLPWAGGQTGSVTVPAGKGADLPGYGALNVGDKLTLAHGEVGTYTDCNPRSKYPYLYTLPNGRSYKCNANYIKAVNGKTVGTAPKRTKEQILNDLQDIEFQNLICDGELSGRALANKRKRLMDQKAALVNELRGGIQR
jgi:hypothetical protein